MAEREPMIKLEPGGKAAILSYNIPDPTSYSGRNFIELQVPADHFEQVVRLVGGGAETPAIVEAGSGAGSAAFSAAPGYAELPGREGVLSGTEYDLVTPSGVYGLSNGLMARDADELRMPSATLRPLDADALLAIARAGRVPRVYRSIYGTLSYATSGEGERGTEPILPSLGFSYAPDGEGARRTEPALDLAGDGGERVELEVDITSPQTGDTVTGPAGGVTVVVAGTASMFIEGIGGVSPPTVEVRVGPGGFSAATPGAPGDFSTWSFEGNVSNSGVVTIIARVGVAPAQHEKTVTISVSLAAGPSDDATPPELTIVSPADNAVLVGGDTQTVAVTGTASDESSGVSSVELRVGDGSFTTATPHAPDDWSTWTGSVSLPNAGRHTITARGIDKAGNMRTRSIAVTASAQPPPVAKRAQLLLVEVYRLSSFLGNYGAGRVVKTFSLLPGEKTKISVKTFTRTEESRKESSSILDSFTQDSARDFETATQEEQTTKQNFDESFEYSVHGEAQASWGWGSAKISGKVAGGTNAAREDFAKNIANATQKHASKASAKRDVQVNTSYEVKEEKGEETSIERELENINVSRTLNFVFRQMNQEFITLLHLVDVRVAYARVDLAQRDGKTVSVPIYTEVSLSQLDSLLGEVIVPAERANVRADIRYQLENIFDYQDELHSFIEEKQLTDQTGRPLTWLRANKLYTSKFVDEATGTEITVPGIIMAAMSSVMRTEGVIVDALLGQGDALDAYSQGLQDAAVKERQLTNTRTQSELNKSELGQLAIKNKDEEAAAIYAKIYPCCPDNQALVKISTEGADNGELT